MPVRNTKAAPSAAKPTTAATPASTLIGITVIAITSIITSIGGLILRVVRSRIVLYRDGLEVRKLLWSRRVKRRDTVARRFYPSSARSAAYHILITRDGAKINLPPYLENNATLRAWLSEIPLASKGGGALTRR